MVSIAGSTLTKGHTKTVVEVLNLNVAVTEASGKATTTITNNGSTVFTSSDLFFIAPINLASGVNNITISSTDASGRVSAPVNLKQVVFDGTAPQILSLSPATALSSIHGASP